MRARTYSLVAAFAAATAFAACSDQPTSPNGLSNPGDQAVTGKNDKVKPNKERAALLTNVPVSGALSDGGSFVGTFTAQHIAIDEATRVLTITGMLTGTATTVDGATSAISQVVSAPATLTREAGANAALVRPVAMQATCDILFLDLGPLHLDLLGLTLDLSEVVLDLNAVSGAGNLLGNLLCAVVGLLDGFGLLAAITQLLDSINAILSGLQGIGGGLVNSVTPAGAVAGIGFQFHT
jgi:hypothetical protein